MDTLFGLLTGFINIDDIYWRSLLSIPFTPLPFFWLMLGTALILYQIRKVRLACSFFGGAIIWMLMISTNLVPDLLVAKLEDRYGALLIPSSAVDDSTIYIMVLGAGHTNNPALPVTGQLSGPELGRLIEGVRLQRQLPGSVLVTSGKKGTKNTESQAATVRQAAIELGVPASQTDTLSFTTNTMDEAQYFQERFGRQAPLILVTDAVHMPRAMRWFRKAGLNPVPAPANFILKGPPGEREISLIPNSNNIENMEKAMHEYLGMLWMELVHLAYTH